MSKVLQRGTAVLALLFASGLPGRRFLLAAVLVLWQRQGFRSRPAAPSAGPPESR